MDFIQDESGVNFINITQVERLEKNGDDWGLYTIGGDYYPLSTYTLSRLLDWPSSYVYWASDEEKDNFKRKYNRYEINVLQ